MYAYQGDVYCDDCGEKIADEIQEQGEKIGSDDGGVDNGDTNDFPQCDSSSAESDCPMHCNECGAFLENELTDEGRKYVANAIRRYVEDEEKTEDDTNIVIEWAEFYDGLEWTDLPLKVAKQIAALKGWGSEIKAVRYRTSAYDSYSDLPFYEEYDISDAKFFLYADELGLRKLVFSDNESDAYSAYVDECAPIPFEEVPEAYGAFDELRCYMAKTKGHEDTQHLRDFCNRYAEAYFNLSVNNEADEWDLEEGYEYQSNSTDSGIVNVGHYLTTVNPDNYDIVIDMSY